VLFAVGFGLFAVGIQAGSPLQCFEADRLCPFSLTLRATTIFAIMKNAIQTNSTAATVEEYVVFEEQSDVRHEFVNGNLIPMPGTTFEHNEICFNITAVLKALLRGRGFRVYMENVKAQITSGRDYTYPDIVITSDPRDLEGQYIVKHPVVIIEVLSKTSRVEDSTDKFIRYKNIESLQNYLLVDSEKMVVEVRTKLENGSWEAASFVATDDQFPVPALAAELRFEDVYEGVRLK